MEDKDIRLIDANALKEYMCSVCDDRERCEDTEQVCSEIAEIDEQPTIMLKAEKVNEVCELIRMYLENISEDIDRTRESIARLEGKLTALNIERSRLESIQERFNEGKSGARMDGGADNA